MWGPSLPYRCPFARSSLHTELSSSTYKQGGKTLLYLVALQVHFDWKLSRSTYVTQRGLDVKLYEVEAPMKSMRPRPQREDLTSLIIQHSTGRLIRGHPRIVPANGDSVNTYCVDDTMAPRSVASISSRERRAANAIPVSLPDNDNFRRQSKPHTVKYVTCGVNMPLRSDFQLCHEILSTILLALSKSRLSAVEVHGPGFVEFGRNPPPLSSIPAPSIMLS